jgi:hypothetical protein
VIGELIGVRQEERVTLITLQREEKLNALSAALEGELLAALAEEAVRKGRCVVAAGPARRSRPGRTSASFAPPPQRRSAPLDSGELDGLREALQRLRAPLGKLEPARSVEAGVPWTSAATRASACRAAGASCAIT